MANKKSNGSDGDVRVMQSGVGDGFFIQVLGGKGFIHCIVELLKNCRDYRASTILLQLIDGARLRMVDNGHGMCGDNRDSFISVNQTTAVDENQAGRFGTGTTQMLFSHATEVEVKTVSLEEPDRVYIFRFSAEEKDRLMATKGKLVPRRVKKTDETWPYEFSTGTEITYVLRNPKSRGIRPFLTNNCRRLAAELAARLPCKFRDILQVGGEPIPEKEIVGKIFRYSEVHPELGTVDLELYRPVKKHADEELRLTGVEIGEVPFANFVRVVGEELRERIPSVFLYPDVCGTITVSYLREYPNEDRMTINPAIADDTRTVRLIEMLRLIAPQVQESLNIKLAQKGAVTNAQRQQVVDQFLGVVSQAYPAKEGRRVTVAPGESVDVSEPKHTKPLTLTCRHEFEPGEDINVRLYMSEEVRRRFNSNQVKWHTGKSLSRNPRQTREGLTMIADQLGVGSVRADIPGTPWSVIAKYTIVRERTFHLSAEHMKLRVGSKVYLFGVNMDKLKGDHIVWGHAPPKDRKEVEHKDAQTVFHARSTGKVVITARDSGDPDAPEQQCEIIVEPEEQPFLRIRDQHFAVIRDRVDEAIRPILMTAGGEGSPHTLFINVAGIGCATAEERDETISFLAQATGAEFARFMLMDLRDEEEGPLDPRDVPELFNEHVVISLRVYEELMKADKVT